MTVNLPDIFTFADGARLETPAQWERRRRELLRVLCREEYGCLPPAPLSWRAEALEEDPDFCAGKVTLSKVRLTVALPGGEAAFPVYCAVPKAGRPCPAFLHINFRDNVPDKYMPTEEICDAGFAVVSFCYTDVTSDDGDFSDGLAGAVYGGAERGPDGPGKIALWAWAAMRVMDYIQTLDGIDTRNVAVIGHSRLGKTALLAGASDGRFAFVISNDSGCSGAAISRGKASETVADICRMFPYWFCENYQKYAGHEDKMPFDQHFLLAAIAPRGLYVSDAEDDAWAGPQAEFNGCIEAGRAYEFLGRTGFVRTGDSPRAGESLHEGDIGYHMRPGVHYLGREDWRGFMGYVKRHINGKAE